MAGIRIWHPQARSGVFTFAQTARPYRTWNPSLKRWDHTPLVCVPCGKLHATKTYHINVDADGFAIVSPVVWSKMREYGAFGFQAANEVASPPPLSVNVAVAAALRGTTELTAEGTISG